MSDTLALTIGQHSIAGRKTGNEDSYGVLMPGEPALGTKGVAMVIADGMSGAEAGKEASESCVKAFMIDYYSTSESLTVKTAGGQILAALNRWLYGQGQSVYGTEKGLVSTLSALVLKSATAHIFHVGDARISRFRDGALEPLTEDHRVIVSADKSFLSRAVGIDLKLDVDYRAVPVEVGDTFVFTTDGVHEFLRDADMAELLLDLNDNADATAAAIVSAAYENGSADNLTCQIVRVDALGAEEENEVYRKLRELPFPPPLDEGMVLDGYRVVRELHASKRTQVYLAVDTDTLERVVIKTPSVNYEDDPTYLQLFSREEWIGKRINSPHVMKIREQARPRKFLYYITEYVEGPTLRQWMDDNPNPHIDRVRDIIGQIAVGIRAFHRKEMIHQDLKPENIIIDGDGTVKIIDFGSVKIAGLEDVASPLDNPGLLGTIDYTAPEYLLDEPPSNRADIYSLGIIAYEMLSGHHPYGKGFSARRQIGNCVYTVASKYNPDVPDWIDGALRKAVQCDRARRYETLSEFICDLTRPNPLFVTSTAAPLLQRDPVAFWKGLAFLLAMICLFLLLI
ncbi:MAG: protein kinase domain-containing protein [Alphaproteobacteria bacterium]